MKFDGSKHIRKSFLKAFRANQKHFLLKWKHQCDMLRGKQDGAENILRKLRKRLLRLGFDRYQRGVALLRQDIFNTNKVREVKARLTYRLKKRVYSAIKNFSGSHHNAKIFLKNYIKRMDKINKQLAYNHWVKYWAKEIEEEKFVAQAKIVANIDELTQA